MKTLLTLFVILFMSTFSFGQICNPATQTVYEKISEDQVMVTLSNDCDKEIGYLTITNEKKFIRHGIWKSYCNGNLKMTVKYKNGKVDWIKTDKQDKITYTEIVNLRNLMHESTVVTEITDGDQ